MLLQDLATLHTIEYNQVLHLPRKVFGAASTSGPEASAAALVGPAARCSKLAPKFACQQPVSMSSRVSGRGWLGMATVHCTSQYLDHAVARDCSRRCLDLCWSSCCLYSNPVYIGTSAELKG